MENNALDIIAGLLADRKKLLLHRFDEDFVQKVLNQQMQLCACESESAYVEHLLKDEKFIESLIQKLLNSHSEFFRNLLIFAMVESVILPIIYNRTDSKHELRIWSAGCARGQEAYSLAMLVDQYLKLQPNKKVTRIFATDIQENNIAKALLGKYPITQLKNLRVSFLDQYFRRSGDYWQISGHLRKIINFSQFDLLNENLQAPPNSLFGEFDLIMCSNVLIYYKADLRQYIIKKLLKSLVKGGYFICSEAEIGITSGTRGLRQINAYHPIFVKTN
ncbi:MAG: hypothetical protein KKD74_14220 [Bacteroidetes bacterium]|nr:hypothetical protein [Bacteroidota bacterium]